MKFKSLLFSLLLTSILPLAGCNGSNQTKKEDTPIIEERIVLNSSQVNLNLNDSFLLQIAYSNVDASKETIFTSSDSDIVSVDDTGLVLALSEGKATVNVTKGEATADCSFTVSLADEIPYIIIDNIDNNYLEVDMTTTFELDPKARFGNRDFEIDNLNFEIIPGSGNGRIENNIFYPTQKGNLTIRISGSYKEITLHGYYLSVLIKESIVFSLKDDNGEAREFGSVYIYSIDEYKGITYKTKFKPLMSVFVDGVDKTNELTYEFIDENHVFTFDTSLNLITANKVGEASLKLKYLDYSATIPFYSNYLIDRYESEDIIVDASIGEFPADTIFNNFPGSHQIIKATSVDEKVEYEVSVGKILGLKSHNFSKQQIIVYNDKIGLIVNYKAYAKILTKPEDLKEFCINFGDDGNLAEVRSKVEQFQNDGYYLLANDLDCTGITYPNNTRMLGNGAGSIEQSCGFMGTFDGQGHTIKNYKAPREGMFLIIGTGAVIKNVAFVDAILDTASGRNDEFVLATYCYNAAFENVYISSSSNLLTPDNALVAANVASTCTITNCLFEYTGSANNMNFGSFTHLCEMGSPKFVNSYVVSQVVMSHCLNFNYYADSRTYSEFSSLAFRRYSDVGHYLNYNEMKAAHLDLSSFNTDYWDISTGVPEWK